MIHITNFKESRNRLKRFYQALVQTMRKKEVITSNSDVFNRNLTDIIYRDHTNVTLGGYVDLRKRQERFSPPVMIESDLFGDDYYLEEE